MLKKYAQIIATIDGFLCLGFLTGQQIVVGVVVYLSVVLADGLSAGTFDPILLYALVLFHLIAFFPGLISDLFFCRWEVAAISKYWQQNNNHLVHTTKESVHSIYLTQARDALSELISFTRETLSVLLNSVFSAALIGYFLSPRLFLGYFIGVVLAGILLFLLRKKLKNRAADESTAAADAITILTATKSNLSLGAKINKLSWRRTLKGKISELRMAVTKNATLRTSMSAATTIVIALPIIAAIFSIEDQAVLIAVAINIPRLFQIINSSLALFELAGDYFSLTGYLKVVFSAENSPADTLDAHIDINNICIDNKNYQTLEAAVTAISRKESGLIIVSGKNGSGKTSFLREVSTRLGASYFNPKLRPIWPTKTPNGLSDGEYTCFAIHQLIKNSKEPLLLDEWNAFLDKTAEIALRQKIISESAKRRIVLVEHGNDAGEKSVLH